MSQNIINLIKEMQSIAQTGLAYGTGEFDLERYQRMLEITSEIGADLSKFDYEQVLELFSYDKGYNTPKVDVRGAAFKNNQILLVREMSDNLWALPGGWADVNLSPAENVLKEIKEETGYDCQVNKLIGVYDKSKSNRTGNFPHVYKIFFLCEIVGGGYIPSIEINEIGFFGENNIPDLSQGRVSLDQIKQCFAHYTNQKLAAEYD